jgi:hypothetical protein
MSKFILIACTLAIGIAAGCLLSNVTRAELWNDYSASKEAWQVTQVKVQGGRLDDYLENLKRTFVPGAELAKRNGTLVDYHILVNRNQVAPGATVLVIEQYVDWMAVAPNNRDRDLKERAELRKSLSKVDSDKLMSERNDYRTFIDEGTFWAVEFNK